MQPYPIIHHQAAPIEGHPRQAPRHLEPTKSGSCTLLTPPTHPVSPLKGHPLNAAIPHHPSSSCTNRGPPSQAPRHLEPTKSGSCALLTPPPPPVSPLKGHPLNAAI